MKTKSNKEVLLNQIELQEKIQSNGLNIVTCGNCSSVLIHELQDETIDCFCGNTMDLSDCPDLYYSGIEESDEFKD